MHMRSIDSVNSRENLISIDATNGIYVIHIRSIDAVNIKRRN